MPTKRILLKNAYLWDPKNNWMGQRGTLLISAGKIEQLGDGAWQESGTEIDLDGMIVTPGLIDFHAHFFAGGTNTSLEFFQYYSGGVTNAVDAGSAGTANFESFLKVLSERERRNSRFYLNVSSEGLSCLGDHCENINPKYFNDEEVVRLCTIYSKEIIGLKIRISREIAEYSNTSSFEALSGALRVADQVKLPLSVHMPDFQGELKGLIDMLRPGDVFCHVFTPKKGILENGKVSEEMKRAVQKGIVLESACGKGHFGHACAQAAMTSKLRPDIISGDFTKNTYYHQPAVSLPYLMSRFLALGMPFEEVLACCTSTPAEKMKLKGEVGCLLEGAKANIAVFKMASGKYEFTDVCGDVIFGDKMLIPMMTISEGDIVYKNSDLWI